MKSLDPEIRTFTNETNQGFAKNNNFLAKKANGDFLCFLNNDVFVSGNWLSLMLQALDQDTEIGIVGNVQRLAYSKQYDHMGVVFSPQGNPRHYGQGFFHRPFVGQIKRWSAVTAACCLMRRDFFLEIGGFDETFINGCEDVDLCLKINDSGKFCVVVHDSVVEHVKSPSEGRKKFNAQNFANLRKKWGDKILFNQAVNDQFSHAKTYFFRGLTRPWSTNLGKWLQAILILTGLKKLKSS